MNIYIRTTLLFVLTYLSLSMFPLCAFAYTDEGPVLWASGGNVMQRTHSEVTGVLGAPVVAIPGLDAKFITVRANPLSKEYVLGIQDSAGTLHAYHSSDGVSWIADWTVSVGDGNVARFDIVYEQTTGRALVVYRGRIVGGKTTFYYRIWSAGAWGTQTEITIGTTSGNIVLVRLAARPSSNQIGLIYFDDTRSAAASFWSGSAWTNFGTKITNNGTIYTGYTGTYPPVRSADISFETVTGALLVAVGENSSNRIRYATRSAAGSWSGVSSLNTVSGYGDFIRLSPSPTTDEIALASCTMEPSVSSYICDFVMWSGTAFGTPTSDLTSGTMVDGDMSADAFWLVDGSNRVAVAVYGNDVTNGIDWYQSTNGGSFVAQTTDTSPPTTTTNEGQFLAVPITGYPSQSLMLIDDVSNAGYMKRVTLSGTSVSWASVAPGSSAELTASSYPVTSSTFARMGMALQIAPPVFVMGTTSASTVTNIPSGSTNYIADPTCTSATNCTGFTLATHGKSAVTVSRIMLTNSGTINLGQTSNWTLDIDSDANPNNGVTRSITGTVSGNTITFTVSPTLSVNPGQRLHAFPKATFGNAGTYPQGGQTVTLAINSINDVDTTATPTNDEALIGIPMVSGVITPNITGYTNGTESGLSYASNCVNCGGRLGAGTFAQTLTVNGYGFGPDPGAGNRATALNQVAITGAATTMIASANISSWSNTQIIFALNTANTGNADSDFGTNYGGVNALLITAGGATGSGVNFYLFPQVTALVVPTGLGPDGAKEYSASDTDGVVTLLGTRLGANQNNSVVQILGCSATTCSSPTNSVVVESWSNTAVKVEVPVIIADNLYTGTISFTRDFPVASAAQVNYPNIFSVRPRLLSITPTSGGWGDTITLSGNHLCPAAGGCPTGTLGTDSNTATAPGFSSSDNVVLAGATANYWNSWSHTQVVTAVPSVASLGASNAVLTAGTFPAGQMAYTVINNNVSNPPSSLAQFATTTQNTSMITSSGQTAPAMNTLSVGGATTANTVFFGGVISSSSGLPGSMRLAVEVLPVGSNFICGAGACASETQGPLVAGPASVDCTVLTNNCRAAVSLTENAYHWRARTEYIVNGITYFSAWVSYPSTSTNLETAADFYIDQTPPSILNISSGSPSTNGATITWNTSEPATQLLQLNKTGTFTNSCASANGCSNESLTVGLSHSATLSNLDSNTLYYYRLYAADSAGNTSWSAVQQFTTLGVTQPAKTLYFHVLTSGVTTAPGSLATSTFTIVIPETAVQFQSIFFDVRGLYQTTGSVANATIAIQVNGGNTISYTLPDGRAIFAPWRLYHQVSTLNISPGTNTITVTAGPDTTLSSIGADAIVTYSYTP